MTRRTLSELNLMDDFLFHEAVTRDKKGEEFCRILLSTILGRKIKKVRVVPQKVVLGRGTEGRGIRMDAYIEEVSGEDGMVESGLLPDIYDMEPNKYKTDWEERRARYYHALIDTKLLKTGEEYEKLNDVYVILILPYDPFGKNRMVYTISSHCEEEPEMAYDDGQKTIFLYTRGEREIPSQELKDMLEYMERSTAENVTSQELYEIDQLVEEVRKDQEVGVRYMKAWEIELMARKEGIEQGIQALILDNIEEGIPEERIIEKLQRRFSLGETKAREYYERFSTEDFIS